MLKADSAFATASAVGGGGGVKDFVLGLPPPPNKFFRKLIARSSLPIQAQRSGPRERWIVIISSTSPAPELRRNDGRPVHCTSKLCVLCASVVKKEMKTNHRGTEA